jgi:tetratricopeptide (TPR) repeat protein
VVTLGEADVQFKTNPADAEKTYGHAFKVMTAYERWLAKAGEEGKRQLTILYLLGLFEGPADPDCLATLRAKPVVKGLTTPVVGLTEAQWNTLISRLDECGIVSLHAAQSAGQFSLDCHPLVREYFGNQLRRKSLGAWREAHRRLYEHLKNSTDELPDTIERLQPLYEAIAHGCQAGEVEEALIGVYWNRISRGFDFFSTVRLGGVASDLQALRNFFETPWSRPNRAISEHDQASLLSWVGFRLWALGRLSEARSPMKASLKIRTRQNNNGESAMDLRNLGEVSLIMGDVTDAVDYARQSILPADRHGMLVGSLASRSLFGHALHMSGESEKATKAYQEAETLQRMNLPQYPFLLSFDGYRYCELLLDQGQHSNVLDRCRHTLSSCLAVGVPPLEIGLERLALGRAMVRRLVSHGGGPSSDANAVLEQALQDLKQAAQQQYLPPCFLCRAQLRFIQDDLRGCGADLDKAWEIAERGSMRLYMADVLLSRAKMFSDKEALVEARKLIDECGYHRRDTELDEAEEAAKGW